MAWYHQYQFAEVIHPLYPKLCGLALPILRYEILNDKIIAVEVQIKDGQIMWFKRKRLRLYKSGKDLVLLPEQISSNSYWKRLLKRFNLKGR